MRAAVVYLIVIRGAVCGVVAGVVVALFPLLRLSAHLGTALVHPSVLVVVSRVVALRARLGVRVQSGQFALVGAGYQEVARHLRAGPALRVIEAYAACGGEHDDAEKRENRGRASAWEAPAIF